MVYRLATQDEETVQRIIATGRYHEIGQVVSVALRQLDERERGLDNLRAALAVGLEQVERGEVIEWTPELADEIWMEAQAAASAGKQPKADVCPV